MIDVCRTGILLMQAGRLPYIFYNSRRIAIETSAQEIYGTVSRYNDSTTGSHLRLISALNFRSLLGKNLFRYSRVDENLVLWVSDVRYFLF